MVGLTRRRPGRLPLPAYVSSSPDQPSSEPTIRPPLTPRSPRLPAPSEPAPVALRRPQSLACRARHAPCVLALLGRRSRWAPPSYQRAGHLLPPGALGRIYVVAVDPALAPAGQRPAAADRDQAGADDREAAVGERHQVGAAVAAVAHHPDDRDPVDVAAQLAVAAGRPHREDLRGSAPRQRRRGLV